MAESSDSRKGDSLLQTKITLLQPQHLADASQDLQVAGAKDATTTTASRQDPDQSDTEDLPDWFKFYFPLLSVNETFKVLYWYLVVVVATIKEAFLLDLLRKWIHFLKFLFSPTLLVAKWILWIVSSLMVKPALYLILSVAGILGINDALKNLFVALIRAIDSNGDKFMTTAGTLITYIKEQWHQSSHDFLEALQKLKQWAKETLEAMVQAIKYIMKYVSDVLQMIMPSALFMWAHKWIHFGCFLSSKIYAFVKSLLIAFEKVLDVIKNAWNSDPRDSPSSDSDKVFSSDPKQTEQSKPSVAPSKPVEAVTAPPAAVAEDSTKPRKA